MTITLIDLAEAGERMDAGEQAYEYQTDNKALRILGRDCGFGADYLRRLRGEGAITWRGHSNNGCLTAVTHKTSVTS
jgi:hypothetical protein